MNITNVFAGIMTGDIETASKWYENLFDRKFDSNPMENVYQWNFPDGGMLQLVSDEERAGYSSITLLVNSRDEQLEILKTKNIAIGQKTESEIANTVTINDPEGNRITFAETVTEN